MRLLLSITFALGAWGLSAQNYLTERKLVAPQHDGFHRIDLTPDIMPEVNGALSNIRIADAQGKEVPYLLRQESPVRYNTVFHPYRIVQNDRTKNCCSTLVLANEEGKAINNIHLSIRNAAVAKLMTLTGSDDQKTWYALSEPTTITASGDGKKVSTLELVDFPLSNYAYYKIDFADSTSAPLNVTAAGYFEVNVEEAKYASVPLDWEKADSARIKKSYIHLRMNGRQVIDRITLSMKGAPYFQRTGWLLQEQPARNGRVKPRFNRIAPFTVSSRQPAVIETSGLRGADFVLEIENEDNPSLEVASIEVSQLHRYMVAWLKKGDAYDLKFGEERMRAPNYDLVNFKDSIPQQIPILQVGPLRRIEVSSPAESNSIFNSKALIWVAIAVVIGVLGFMAVKMTREM